MPETKRAEPKKKTSLSLIIVLAAVLFIAAAYFLIWPRYSRLGESKDKLLFQKNLLQTQTEYLGNLQKLISNYESIKTADKEKLARMLPKEVDEPALFTLFESLATKNNITMLAIDISEKEPGAEIKNLGLKEVHIAVNLASNLAPSDIYGDFKNFLTDLEINIRLMDVISINYTPESASYVLNARTYRLEGI
jgi:Tfp pilus assembly protein PilO